MKTKNQNSTIWAVWMIAVLVGATGLGYAIRQIRWSLAAGKTLSESRPAEDIFEREPEAETVEEPAPEVEVVEIETTDFEEPVWEEPEVEPDQQVAVETQRQMWQMGPNGDEIRKFFDDLNLNEQEQARLREGMELMRRRFENMTYEERAAEFLRMAEIGERWRNMSDQEREQVRQRMRERYEVWRRSDSIEIPRLTLD